MLTGASSESLNRSAGTEVGLCKVRSSCCKAQQPKSARTCHLTQVLCLCDIARCPADVLEAALKARAELAPQIPKARAAVAATTATARKLRAGLVLTRVAAGMYDIGRAVRMQFTVAAAEQVLQQYAAAQGPQRPQQQVSKQSARKQQQQPQRQQQNGPAVS